MPTGADALSHSVESIPDPAREIVFSYPLIGHRPFGRSTNRQIAYTTGVERRGTEKGNGLS